MAPLPTAPLPRGVVVGPFTLPPPVSAAGLNHLAAHKYVAGAYSSLDAVLNPFWVAVTEALPLWLAPNAVTLLGTLLVLATLPLSAVAVPCGGSGGTPTLPPWAHAVIVAAIFAYQTLDACDGKQARRTGSSSPLGQLFDHGCDALVGVVVAWHTLHGLGHPLWGAGGAAGGPSVAPALLLPVGLFVLGLAPWEEHVTRVLRTNVNGFGVTEMQFIAMGVHVAAGVLGARGACGTWSQPLGLALPPAWGRDALSAAFAPAAAALARLSPQDVSVAICFCSFINSGLSFMWTVAVTHRRPSLLRVLLGPACLLATAALFFAAPLRASLHLGDARPGALLLTLGLAQTLHTTRVIVGSMAREELRAWPAAAPLLASLALPAVAAVGGPGDAELVLGVYAGAILTLYAAYVGAAVTQIAAHLRVRVFVINGGAEAVVIVPAGGVVATKASTGGARERGRSVSRPAPSSATAKRKSVSRVSRR